MEHKTCLLEVYGENTDKGLLYFNRGILYDAVFGDMKGEDAAIELLTLDNVRIHFKDLPKKKIKKRIETGLMPLLIEGARLKDEKTSEVEEAEPHGELMASDEGGEEGRTSDTTIRREDLSERPAEESKEDALPLTL